MKSENKQELQTLNNILMKTCKKLVGTILCIAFAASAQAQQESIQKDLKGKGYIKEDLKGQGYVHSMSDSYIWPTDPEVLKKLNQWQDMKFGVMFHWGVYSVPGISESWPLCSEDRFIARRRKAQPDLGYEDFKKWYWGLSEQLSPTEFNPKGWADIMNEAGMKYLIFTTKHHDGFCMFDSKETDYTIAKGPFKNHPLKDVTCHVFDAFRQKGFMIGAYFSKPDWHCPYYWHPDKATPDRNMNYDIAAHPDWWKKYQQFTANQIKELMTDYGTVDMLWLDGGWVKAPQQDIRIDEIVDRSRKAQPGLIVVDRTVHGPNENYLTPELRIPPKQLPYPWESCITLTNRWGWWPNAPYKSARHIINILSEISAKGGSLVLGIGPKANGEIEAEALPRLKEIGAWLKTNGRAIYNTRITPVYNSGNVWFTADKDGKTLYAIYALPEGEDLPETIEWTGNPAKGTMKLLQGNRNVKYANKDGKVIVTLPKGIKNEPLAFSFKLKK